MAKRYGAAVIALTIDEEGMALTAEKKLAIAHRIFELATRKYGMRRADLIFDALTLPISTGQEDYRTAGMETLKAVEAHQAGTARVPTILGVSNISFGLNAYARRVLNSRLHARGGESTDSTWPSSTTARFILCTRFLKRRLSWRAGSSTRTARSGDPLQNYMAHFAGHERPTADGADGARRRHSRIEDKLKFCIIQGEKGIGDGAHAQSLEELLEEALSGSYSPLDLINNVLLDGMRTVGDLFGARKMQLPIGARLGLGDEGGRGAP